MELGKHPVPERPTNLDYSRARAYCSLDIFFSRLSLLSSSPLSLGDGPIYTEIFSQGAV